MYEASNFSTFSSTLVITFVFDYSQPSGCEVGSLCGFDLHLLDDWQCWTFFHMLVGHLCIFLGELSIQILCPFLNWVIVFIYSRYKSLNREIIGKYLGLSSHFWKMSYTKVAGACLLQVSNQWGNVTAPPQSFLSWLPLRVKTWTYILEATIQCFQQTNSPVPGLDPTQIKPGSLEVKWELQ